MPALADVAGVSDRVDHSRFAQPQAGIDLLLDRGLLAQPLGPALAAFAGDDLFGPGKTSPRSGGNVAAKGGGVEVDLGTADRTGQRTAALLRPAAAFFSISAS